MQGFVQGADRQQTTLLPECLDDWVDEGNSIRAVDVFVDALELRDLGFDGVDPAATGRPAAGVPSFADAQALHLRLSQPGAIEPAAGARGWPPCAHISRKSPEAQGEGHSVRKFG